MTSLHIACYCSSVVSSCLQLLPKIFWYLETPPKQICMDKDQEEPSYFSIAATHRPPPNIAPKWGSPSFPRPQLFNGPTGKEWKAQKIGLSSPLGMKKNPTQSTAVSISIPEITYSSRIALEPSCVSTEQWAKHASTHAEEVTNPALPSTCSQTAPTRLWLLPAMSKPQLRHKEWAGTKGIIQLPCCTFSVPEQGSILSAHQEVQARGLYVKLSFHVINSHVK